MSGANVLDEDPPPPSTQTKPTASTTAVAAKGKLSEDHVAGTDESSSTVAAAPMDMTVVMPALKEYVRAVASLLMDASSRELDRALFASTVSLALLERFAADSTCGALFLLKEERSPIMDTTLQDGEGQEGAF